MFSHRWLTSVKMIGFGVFYRLPMKGLSKSKLSKLLVFIQI